MNILFVSIFVICGTSILLKSPDLFLSALLEGGQKAATTCLALLSSYAIWMGLIHIWEECGIANKVARFIKPLAKKLLLTDDEKCLEAVSMNLSVNLLGISGAATPYGIQAAQLLDKTPHAEYASCMFFVLNATSLQILPASMIALRTSLQSSCPTDIVLPTLITTLFSTLLGVSMTALFLHPKKQPLHKFSVKKDKMKRVCMQ